jgi:hypothetical protein
VDFLDPQGESSKGKSMASSIHIEAVKTGSFLHNDRTMKVSYLIGDSDNNECTCSAIEATAKYNSLKDQAQKNYTERTKQKMQKSTIFLKEAIVNLQKHHTLDDLKPVIEKLESYGFTVLQASIHRDEGFIDDDSKSNFNYHAHITMFNLDAETGKSVKFGKDYRAELSRLQTLTANTLKMERGSCSVSELAVSTEKAKKRLDTHDFKHAMKIKQASQKDLKKEVAALRAELQAQGAGRTDYAKLEALNKELKAQIEGKELSIQEMNQQLKKLEIERTDNHGELFEQDKMIKELKSKVETMPKLEKELISARETILDLKATISIQNEQISSLEQALTDLKHKLEAVGTALTEYSSKAIDKARNLLGLTKPLPKPLEDSLEPPKIYEADHRQR